MLALVPRLGIAPSTAEVLNGFIDAALPSSAATVLDAGCGRLSALAAFRPRIKWLVGVDIHAPNPALAWLAEFPVADLCADAGAFPVAGFDDIEVRTTGHLARAWQRRIPTFVLGLLGDLAAQPFAARRSTIVARATAGPRPGPS